MKLDECCIEEVSSRWIAEFAPLSKPHLLLLLRQDPKLVLTPTFSSLPQLGQSEAERWLYQLWARFVEVRNTVYSYTAPFVLAEGATGEQRLTTPWLQEAIRENDPLYHLGDDPAQFTPETTTMTLWRDRGLIRGDWNKPDGNWAAATLIMRAMITKRRRWLPSCIPEEEPWFWVWSIGPDDQEPMPCPVPLRDPPRNRLLYSPWPLTGILPGWKLIHKRGAFRWSRGGMVNGRFLWDLTLAEMFAWGVPLGLDSAQLEELQQPFGKLPTLSTAEKKLNERQDLHATADQLLSTIGKGRLSAHLKRYYSIESPSPFGHLCR